MSPRPSGADSVPASWSAEQHIAVAERRSAHNYHPLPVVIAHGEGAGDRRGGPLSDCLAGYSAVNFGHRNPELLAAARAQLDRITLTSRAFHHDRFAPFVAALADLVGKEQVLPVNTGAEAVETGIKIARKWGYEVKGVPDGRAVIVVASGNFHGRTTTIVSFSTDPAAYRGFGPPTPGFRIVPYGDAAALADAIDADTVAVLVEPVQGEAGVIVPPADYLPRVRDLCTRAGILLIADEVQSGLGRTGTVRACDHSGVDADIYLFGKALGGGILPVAAAVGDAEVFDVIRPGQHGSTFGGNALACAVGTAVVGLVRDGPYLDHVRALAPVLRARLDQLVGNGVVAARSIGLWAGIDVDPTLATGRELCERLLQRGVLVKDTHGSTIRLSPPLVITEDELHWAVDQIAAVLADLRAGR